MPKQVILVRHAAPRVDPTRAPADWELSDEGLVAAAALSSRLPRQATFASSTEPKAVATLRAVAGTEPVLDARFAEVQRPIEPVAEDFRTVRRAWVSGALDSRHTGWERPSDAARRFADGLDALADDTVVVATHGMVLTAWLVSVGEIRPGAAAADFWEHLGIPDLVEVSSG